ncbi:hypothetical protein D7Y13_35530 [Corallococcus praedator]|uniref:Uncharacterized protein n=1 Tax=Corallococcus praedator TaxID=2316724 RepID=A0ABX9Q6P5_9BACT|nr:MULTISPECIES: hypothetical protein [Corallococcus]RKH02490.1 hypothetical protein D7X74_37125 [Corallococcus sp. CA047B]RKH21301.1 hypothetical protein D7X75_37075 [Corallococcus sp. CA031C]RKH92755.1 hypothetical protein D7Y13_35530 [Corallococcus praedator]
MSQQTYRPAPPTADATADLPESVAADAMADLTGAANAMGTVPATATARAPLPVPEEAFPPFAELLNAVRSPGADRVDIEAFIAAMGRAPTAEETPRARADVLLDLMARENPMGDYRGRDGTKVRHAAKAALLSLGYPYALELPPELLDTPQARTTEPYTGPGAVGVVATLLSALYQSGIVLVAQLVLSFRNFDWDRPWTEPFLPALLAVWVPTLCALFGLGLGKRTLHVVGAWGLWLLLAAWSVASIIGVVESGPFWPLFLPWHLALWAAWTMRPGPDPEAPAPQPASKR